jgi:hypothetical protein
MYLIYFVIWAATRMSKRTSYNKNYHPNVRSRPCLPRGRGFIGGQVFSIRGHVSASARGQASRGQWAVQTWGRVRMEAGLGGQNF